MKLKLSWPWIVAGISVSISFLFLADSWAIHCLENAREVGMPRFLLHPIEIPATDQPTFMIGFQKVGEKPTVTVKNCTAIYNFPRESKDDLLIQGLHGDRLYMRPQVKPVQGFVSKPDEAVENIIVKDAPAPDLPLDKIKAEGKYIFIVSPKEKRMRQITLIGSESFEGFVSAGENHKILVTMRVEHEIGFKPRSDPSYVIQIYSLEEHGYSTQSLRMTGLKKRPKIVFYNHPTRGLVMDVDGKRFHIQAEDLTASDAG